MTTDAEEERQAEHVGQGGGPGEKAQRQGQQAAGSGQQRNGQHGLSPQ